MLLYYNITQKMAQNLNNYIIMINNYKINIEKEKKRILN